MSGTGATIASQFITQFGDTMFELAQQSEARFRPIVDLQELNGEFSMENRVGYLDTQDLNTRSPEIVPQDIQWDVRQLMPTAFGVAADVDKWDAERMLTDPNSILAKKAVEALERKFDRVCIAALTATVRTGRDASGSLTAAQDGVVTVDATGGFNYETLLQLDANFQGAEVETDSEGQSNARKILFISEQEHQQLMKEGTLISRDFTGQAVVDNGKLRRVGSFDVVIFGSKMPTPQLLVTAGVRQCFAVAMGGLRVRLQKAWDINYIPALQNKWRTSRVTAEGRMGAVRMEGVRIQILNTTAS